MEKLLAKAIEIVLKAHAEQTDKAGMPYIGHAHARKHFVAIFEN